MSSPLLLWMQGWTWIDTWPMVSSFTALFKTTRIMKLKSQLTTPFFAAVNHLRGPLRKQNFTSTGSKGHGLWLVIGGFRSVLGVSVFQCSLLVIVINYDWRQRKTQFWGRLLNFRVRMFVKSAVKLCLQKSPQIIMASSPWWNLFWHRLDNSSGAFYVWRKALSNDLKELCPATKFIKKSNSWNRHQIEWNIKITAQNSKRRYKWHPPPPPGGNSAYEMGGDARRLA